MGQIVDVETGEVIVVQSQFRNPSNYELGQFGKDKEKGGGVSLTVPDQSYTIREILEKFTRGIPVSVVNEGTFENPEGFETVMENAIDITEVEEQLNVVQSRLKDSASKSGKAKISDATTKNEEAASEVEPEAKKAEG